MKRIILQKFLNPWKTHYIFLRDSNLLKINLLLKIKNKFFFLYIMDWLKNKFFLEKNHIYK